MRYFLLPREGLSDDMAAALAGGRGLSIGDVGTVERHCLRYEVDDGAAFAEELEEAQAALATAKALGAAIRVDERGRLCYDVPPAAGKVGKPDEPWQDDAWLAEMLGEPRTA